MHVYSDENFTTSSDDYSQYLSIRPVAFKCQLITVSFLSCKICTELKNMYVFKEKKVSRENKDYG